MYLGVDIGGTKTLIAAIDDNGSIVEQIKFPTPKAFPEFLRELGNKFRDLQTRNFRAACVAVPGRLNRDKGMVINLGNLPWKNQPIQADCEKIFGCPTLIENDANLAGLSEALLHKGTKRVLYITVSTGIGTGVVTNGKLDPGLLDSEGGNLLLPYKGKLTKWESFGSGHAFYEQFGKLGSEVPAGDTKTWGTFARNLAVGFFELIAVIQPELIVIGGSMGDHFNKYIKLLNAELDKFSLPLVVKPKIVQAARPDEAVVFGCYDLVKQNFSK